ncbi:DNA-binding response regulator [Oscillospiraceae bacterium]|nr:DNA-binding response regulator [Oscillospiraceae bacterium]
MGYTILVAEDDSDIVELIELYLENDGYRVLTAADGVSALELVRREQIDLAVLDIMMPRMNGYELTKAIRAQSNFPIIILSAKNADSDKILGLNLGADDYLTKPFNPLEIIARVKSNLRRFYELNPAGTTAPGSGTRLSVGGLELDPASFSLTKDGVPVTLTPMEYKIMACLMKAPGRIFTKVQLYEAANGAYFESDENTMMVHISKLRDKVENDPKNPRYIKTVRGLGYKIENTQ